MSTLASILLAAAGDLAVPVIKKTLGGLVANLSVG